VFSFNQLPSINFSNKNDLLIRLSSDDQVELTDNVRLAGSLTLLNSSLVTNDVDNTSITAKAFVLEATQNIGSISNPIRTNIDSLSLNNVLGEVYLQEQNALDIATMSTQNNVNLALLNGNVTSTAVLTSNKDFNVVANNGDVLLTGFNQLSGNISLDANTVSLNNAITTNIASITADELSLISRKDLLQSGAITVSGTTVLEAGNNIVLSHPQNDFNILNITAAQDASVVDQSALVLAGVDVNGQLTISSVGLNVDKTVKADSIKFDSGTGAFVQTELSAVEAKGDVSVVSNEDITVGSIVSKSTITLDSKAGQVIDGNGDGENIEAKKLVVSVKDGFGVNDGIETVVTSINIQTDKGDLIVINSGDLNVEKLTTTGGNVNLDSTGNIELNPESISATTGPENTGGEVTVDTRNGNVKQVGGTTLAAISSDKTIKVNAPLGDVGEGGIFLDSKAVSVSAARQAGTLITIPGVTPDLKFSGTFTFEDQLLVVEQFDDISPAVFSNVKGYFYNDVSLKLSADQLYDEEDEDEE
jgi:hypothetical protein